MSMDILNRWTRAVIYHSETATTIAEAAVEARADLRDADLTRADLTRADLTRADLRGANLADADLTDANLTRADLTRADLTRADLTRADLTRADLTDANLTDADLTRANLRDADLTDADLTRANLTDADLTRADLTDADLTDANLTRVNLTRANLRDANGINRFLTTPLFMLRDQPGKIRAYKLVNADGVGPFMGGITYRAGESYEVLGADTDESNVQCGPGINLATLDWCMSEWRESYRILIAEFEATDIAAIPTGSDGKFRVFHCKIVGEKDLAEIGLETKLNVKGGAA